MWREAMTTGIPPSEILVAFARGAGAMIPNPLAAMTRPLTVGSKYHHIWEDLLCTIRHGCLVQVTFVASCYMSFAHTRRQPEEGG